MLLPHDPTLAYIVVSLAAVSQLPRFGRAVLAFLRDLHDYLAERQERKDGGPVLRNRNRG